MSRNGRNVLQVCWSLAFFLLGSGVILGVAGSVSVSWQPNSETDLSGYKVYYGTSSRSYSKVVDVGNVTLYEVTELTSGIEYFFAVTAYDTAFNESGYSNEVSTVIGGEKDSIPPSSPEVSTYGIRDTGIYVYWLDNQEADLDGYKVHYGTSSGNYSTVVDVGNVTNYTTGTLTRGVKYYVVVTAYDISGNESDYSTEISIVIPDIDITPPPYPIICDYSVNGREVSISWDNVGVDDLKGYKVYYGLFPQRYDWAVDVNKATNFITTKLSLGLDYYFAITAYDTAFNESDFSQEILLRLERGVVDSLLVQNYPNPFSTNTTIEYAVLDSISYVKLTIYDMLGRFVVELVGKYLEKGIHQIDWTGQSKDDIIVSSGVYICRLTTGNMDRKKYATCKMIILR